MLTDHVMRPGRQCAGGRTAQHHALAVDAHEVVEVGETAGETLCAELQIEALPVSNEVSCNRRNVQRKTVIAADGVFQTASQNILHFV